MTFFNEKNIIFLNFLIIVIGSLIRLGGFYSNFENSFSKLKYNLANNSL